MSTDELIAAALFDRAIADMTARGMCPRAQREVAAFLRENLSDLLRDAVALHQAQAMGERPTSAMVH